MEDFGPNRYIQRRPMAVRKRPMTAAEAIVSVAVIWLLAGTAFSAYMWALEYVGRLYSQLN
jgi:hypothetical protein